MNRRQFEMVIVMVALVSPACEQRLHTGKVGNTRNGPGADGTCPTGQTLCGKDAFAQCLDLQNDRQHCGGCDSACLFGIPCVDGTCQQVACTGPVSVTVHTISSAPPKGVSHVADINGDGLVDLVTWAFSLKPDAGFLVALGKQGGGFGEASAYVTPSDLVAITTGDSNGDGLQDLYVYGHPGWVQVWLGQADGTLTLVNKKEIEGCLGLTVADLNGDGTPDLVANVPGKYAVYLADPSGDFHAGTIYSRCNGLLTLVRDWNGDGSPDLINVDDGFRVCLNRGNGTFADGVDCGIATARMLFAGRPGQVTVIEDLDRDGHSDVAVARDASVDVLLGMGGCQFQPRSEYALTDTIRALASGDVNGDGLSDLVAATEVGSVTLLLGSADGLFEVVPLSAGGGTSLNGTLAVGDVTGDGKADVTFAAAENSSTGGGFTRVLENTCPR